MSLAITATRGAIWTILSSVGSRLIGVIGTLVLTRFIAPTEYGEVSVAVVVVTSVHVFSQLGLMQFVASKPLANSNTLFHVTVFHLASGFLALLGVLIFRRQLGPLFDAHLMTRFIPGLVLAIALERIARIPEQLLVRNLRFGTVAMARSGGELSYVAIGVGLAYFGWGGMAIVLGNIGRNLFRLAVTSGTIPLKTWLTPCRLNWRITRELFAFSLPLALGGMALYVSRYWDNLLVSRFFGTHVVGIYALAYNLADIPATHIGEHIGDVLLPSFARMSEERRRDALVRSTSLLALVVFPLAVGLGTIAPTLTAALFTDKWSGLAPMLTWLAGLSVVRPVSWTIQSYMQASDRSQALLVLELIKVGVLFSCIWGLSPFGPLSACIAVGIAFGMHAWLSILYVGRKDSINIGTLLLGLLQPLIASMGMTGAVLMSRWTFRRLAWRLPIGNLMGEIMTGALSYPAFAWLVAPHQSHELIRLLKRAVNKSDSQQQEQD